MGVYERKDSPFFWIWIEGTSRRFSSKIPLGEGTARKDRRREAQAIYESAMGDQARGRFKLPQDRPRRTFREHAEWYRDTTAAQHRGAVRERSMINATIRHLGDVRLDALTPARLEEWKMARAAEVQKVTVNRELDILKPLLRSAVPTYLETSPAERVRRFRVATRTPVRILTEDAEDRLLLAANVEERAILILALDTLMRRSDVRRLRREHDHRTHLDVVDPKTASPYSVPVSKRLRAALDALPENGPFYFSRVYGNERKGISDVTLHDLFTDLCRRADVPVGRKNGGITFHSLRHTGATRAARHVKLTVVQKLGGWKSLRQLERYDHPDDPELIRAVEAIGRGKA